MALLQSHFNSHRHLLDSTLKFAWHSTLSCFVSSSQPPWDVNTDFSIPTLGESLVIFAGSHSLEANSKSDALHRLSGSLRNFILPNIPYMHKVWGYNHLSSAWNVSSVWGEPPSLCAVIVNKAIRKILLLFWKDLTLDVNLSFKKFVSLFSHLSFFQSFS